ncbi:hypothetical protein, variant [Blastomyces dermatitidis ER-3]|uniref:Uncharacterized protein n=1 Tax=Ajellomyces dermatitidis (strain ER-3 / ATCC MYA-2586) TaxID=559297 RepID=A0ABX2W095_AJEDR|nr:uncharacterized protein BDCG_08403 [Blastomyces dermatitidis ER-3]XP_045282538.1 hypothetical protein, variant [Blastomyces dermatitidis ER-3]EQL29445.1 hypothetical protein BDFG_07989 [Blastomyces dermatitidis ATCC 26199]EQL29446.1 hypothetical protein, variant [Blastomyces dermatitidis ATCC 26199]OAT02810.1 hypothetical protein BDCG_08403 [Blastomyces dermatitidis ER-3]OAT02811.1 hypothetical protein, variant [Blastomyces dermatitidis ER-3]
MRFPTSIPKRLSNFATSRTCVYRSLHTKQAEIITLDYKGSLVTQNVNVDLGNAHEAFTMLGVPGVDRPFYQQCAGGDRALLPQ